MSKFIVAGKYGFLTKSMVKEREDNPGVSLLDRKHSESKDVRDANQFESATEAMAHRLDVTDLTSGCVLMIVPVH